MIGWNDADGRFALVEPTIALRALAAPMHLHSKDDEFTYGTKHLGLDRPRTLPAGPPTTRTGRALHAADSAAHRAYATSPTPLIYLTLGTFSNTNLTVLRTVLDGLAAQPVEVIATVGLDNDPETLRPWPANACVERFIPQGELLPRCSAVVNHGGSSTVFGALAHGLPQLVLPQSADNFINAEMLERSGLGRRLLPEEVTPDAIAHKVADVLADPTPARRAAAQIATMPAPSEIAQLLHERHRQPSARHTEEMPDFS